MPDTCRQLCDFWSMRQVGGSSSEVSGTVPCHMVGAWSTASDCRQTLCDGEQGAGAGTCDIVAVEDVERGIQEVNGVSIARGAPPMAPDSLEGGAYRQNQLGGLAETELGSDKHKLFSNNRESSGR